MDKEVARAARDIATRAALDMIATRGGARRTATATICVIVFFRS